MQELGRSREPTELGPADQLLQLIAIGHSHAHGACSAAAHRSQGAVAAAAAWDLSRSHALMTAVCVLELGLTDSPHNFQFRIELIKANVQRNAQRATCNVHIATPSVQHATCTLQRRVVGRSSVRSVGPGKAYESIVRRTFAYS